jgi:hypothetical protein
MKAFPLLPHRTKQGPDNAQDSPFPFIEAIPQKYIEWLDAQGNENKVQVAEKWVAV